MYRFREIQRAAFKACESRHLSWFDYGVPEPNHPTFESWMAGRRKFAELSRVEQRLASISCKPCHYRVILGIYR
jgi:hypothetical protein